MSTEAATEVLAQTTEPSIVPAATDVKPTEQAAPPEKVSSRIEVSLRREQAALNRERQAKQKETELEAKLKDFEEKFAKVERFEKLKANPDKLQTVLDELGWSYDDLAISRLKDGEIPPEVKIKKLEERFEKTIKDQELEKQRALQAEQQRAQELEARAVDGFKGEIGVFLKDNSTRYELIAFEEQEDLVFEVIDTHYNRTIDPATGVGSIMKIAEAADKVEEWLEKKYDKSRELSKVKSLWGVAPKGMIENAIKQEIKSSQPPKTLTNQLSATPQKPRTAPLTDEERVQRAIANYRASKQL